jgi:hypothetical protein
LGNVKIIILCIWKSDQWTLLFSVHYMYFLFVRTNFMFQAQREYTTEISRSDVSLSVYMEALTCMNTFLFFTSCWKLQKKDVKGACAHNFR